MSKHEKPFVYDVNDDAPQGRILSRREVLQLILGGGAALALGVGSARMASASSLLGSLTGSAAATTAATTAASTGSTAAALAAAAALSCVVRPEKTEGPYYVEEDLNRSDVRIDTADGSVQAGAKLTLKFLVSAVSNSACAALPGAQVEIWHANALGEYSDVSNNVGHDYLRGYQYTDGDGAATFTTIYPGWYSGRAVHIHFKVHANPGTSAESVFTSQLFFDDDFTDQIYTQSPYNTRRSRDTRNSNDNIYGSDGAQLQLVVTDDGAGGYTATFTIGIEVDNVVSTVTPTATATATATATSTPATANFSDVSSGDYFYQGVQYLYALGAVAGYSDGTFRPYSNTTRAQVVKMIVISQGWTLLNPSSATFSDVSSDNTFYRYVETAAAKGIISGYADGTFRPNAEVTRGQVCKIVALAEGWTLVSPANPTFADVPTTHTYYQYVETAASKGVISGYSDGTFHVGNGATRGQIVKIVYQALVG